MTSELQTCLLFYCTPAFLLGVVITLAAGTLIAYRQERRVAADADRRADEVRRIQQRKRWGN